MSVNKHLLFDIESAEVVEESESSQFATIKIFAFNTGWNRHDLYCSLETLKNTASSIYDKPVIYSFSKLFRDFDSHTDPDKSLIAGFVVRDSAEFVEVEDGRTSLSVLAKIWKMYAPQFIKLLKESENHEKKVSVEMELKDYVKLENGEEMLDFEYSAVCVLGDLITEASPGAHLEVLSFAKKEYEKALHLEFSRMYDEIDFSIPEEVKNNAQKGLDLRKQYNRGGTSIGLATARYLIKSKSATPEKIRHIAKYFPRHIKDNLNDKTSDGWIAWMLFGGNSGRTWSTGIAEKMNEIDEREMAYFSDIENFEKITFPYKNKSEMNPALKGINPPISVSQGNEIAKQAEGIGSDDKKNGWAIAISNFKKTHRVEDGKWVRKEKSKNMEEEKKDFEKDPEEENKEKMAEKPEEESKKEEMAEEKENEKSEDEESEDEENPEKEDMSLDANLDVKAILGFLQEETEDYKSLAAEFSDEKEAKNFAKMAHYMFERMKKMAEQLKSKESEASSYMAENEDLKKYKKEKEDEQFNFSVDSILKKIEDKTEIPKDELNALKEKSKEFSLENISVWENLAKARALDFAIKKDSKKEDEEPRYSWGSENNKKPVTTSFWK